MVTIRIVTVFCLDSDWMIAFCGETDGSFGCSFDSVDSFGWMIAFSSLINWDRSVIVLFYERDSTLGMI